MSEMCKIMSGMEKVRGCGVHCLFRCRDGGGGISKGPGGEV